MNSPWILPLADSRHIKAITPASGFDRRPKGLVNSPRNYLSNDRFVILSGTLALTPAEAVTNLLANRAPTFEGIACFYWTYRARPLVQVGAAGRDQ